MTYKPYNDMTEELLKKSPNTVNVAFWIGLLILGVFLISGVPSGLIFLSGVWLGVRFLHNWVVEGGRIPCPKVVDTKL